MTESDIVKQARGVTHLACKPLVNELADEIEQLRAEIEGLRAAREMMQLDAEKYRDETKTLRAEIERLRRLLEIALDAYEDVASDPNIGKPGHFVTQARAALDTKP